MIAPAPEKRFRISGPTIPGFERSAGDGRFVPPHEIELPHPAIEALPSFVCRINSGDLSHGIRHYNGSIARHGTSIFMAYRVESFRAVSSVGVCELDHEFNVIRDTLLEPVNDCRETNIEDPHMASVGGKLIVILCNVVRQFPLICRQRMVQASIPTHTCPSTRRRRTPTAT